MRQDNEQMTAALDVALIMCVSAICSLSNKKQKKQVYFLSSSDRYGAAPMSFSQASPMDTIKQNYAMPQLRFICGC